MSPGTTPPVVEVPDAAPAPELVRRVAGHLEAGEVVALPTETVYGLAVRADDPAAIARIRRLKGRASAQGLTWHVASEAALERFERLRPLARRLAERYWPGPLTLVLAGVPDGLEEIAIEGWTGLRMPAHTATRGVLAGLGFPAVLTSANRHGEPPLTDADQVAQSFGDELALVVDGGPSRMGEASGVLRLGPGHFELLREGLLPLEDLRRTAGLRIGFVCTGNTCRSPMAEGLTRRLLEDRLGTPDLGRFGFSVTSMGVSAGSGSLASRHAVDVLAARGIDLEGHRSRSASPERLLELDRVYCLADSHLAGVRALLPPQRDTHVHLLDPDGGDVLDPIGGSRTDYERCAERIEGALEKLADDWA